MKKYNSIMNRLASIVYYFIRSKKRHGTHSPFMYDFADKCLSTKITADEKNTIRNYQSILKNNSTSITISDFGAGSKKLGKTRKIKDIYSNSQSGNKYGRLLYQLARHYAPQNILEFGTSLGMGTLMLHLGNPAAHIDTIEGCPATHQFTVANFPLKTDKINFINTTFDDFIAHQLNKKYDLIFIDGNHKGEALLHYIQHLIPYSHSHTLWVLDDIRWTDDMWQAWNTIIQQTHFHVTVDLLRMGILVERKEQFKEHFWIHL